MTRDHWFLGLRCSNCVEILITPYGSCSCNLNSNYLATDPKINGFIFMSDHPRDRYSKLDKNIQTLYTYRDRDKRDGRAVWYNLKELTTDLKTTTLELITHGKIN